MAIEKLRGISWLSWKMFSSVAWKLRPVNKPAAGSLLPGPQARTARRPLCDILVPSILSSFLVASIRKINLVPFGLEVDIIFSILLLLPQYFLTCQMLCDISVQSTLQITEPDSPSARKAVLWKIAW